MVDSISKNKIEVILKDTIESILSKETYTEDKVTKWMDQLCEDCMEKLVDLQHPYKYIVSSILMQNNGAGLHSAHSCYYDTNNDFVVQVSWPDMDASSEDSQMICVMTVVAMSL